MRWLATSVAIAMFAVLPARADYIVRDGNGAPIVIKSFILGGSVLPESVPVDPNGNAYSSINPLAIQFGSGILLPSFAAPQHFICDSGCPPVVPYGGAIGANGSPGGFKDGSGNLQALLGDTTNGLWVSVKASAVTAYQYSPSATTNSDQHNLSVATATALTVPADALFVNICARGGAVNYRWDSTAPTGTVGNPLLLGACTQLAGRNIITAVQFIQQSGSTSTIDATYSK